MTRRLILFALLFLSSMAATGAYGLEGTETTPALPGAAEAALAAVPAPPEAAPTAPVTTLRPVQPGSKRMILDLRDADVQTVVNLIARLSDVVVIMGDDVKGKITISSSKEVTIEEANKILMAVLDARGITLTRTEKFLRVMMKRDAIQRPVDTYYGINPEDVPDEDRVVTHIAPLRNANASDVLGNIRPLISQTGNAFESRTTNAIIITDVASNIRRLLKIIGHLDIIRNEPIGEESTTVYPVRYLKAKEIADALGKVFGEKKTQTGKGEVAVRITPIEAANSLVVTAPKELQPQIKSTLDALDIRKRQVMIEVKIVEATTGDQVDFGLRLRNYLVGIGGGNNLNLNVNASLRSSGYLNIALSPGLADAALDALGKTNKLNILSAPRLVTSDNSKAKINVGNEQPILKSVTNLTSSASPNNTVSDFVYKDVGIELEVTPRINADRDVALDIWSKITSIVSNVTFPGDIQAPQIGKRETNTSVTIMDGHTLVIGGLIQESSRDDRQGIPYLMDIPYLGLLFSNLSKVKERTELLIFITPYVIASAAEGREMSDKNLETTGKGFKTMLENGFSKD